MTPADLIDRILAMTPQERYEFRQRSDIADGFTSLALDLEHRRHRLERQGRGEGQRRVA